MTTKSEFMQQAIDEASKWVKCGDGRPFGAVVVKDGKVVAAGHNCTIVAHDATAHGEVCAIRAAGLERKSSDLSGCELYSSCYPCVMCQGATVWAGITKLYYAATPEECNRYMKYDQLFGFKEEQTSEKLQMEHIQMKNSEHLVPFELFVEKK